MTPDPARNTPHTRAVEAVVRVVTGSLVSLRRALKILRQDPISGSKLVLEHACVLSRGVSSLAPKLDALTAVEPAPVVRVADLNRITNAMRVLDAVASERPCRRCGLPQHP
jgi:hypothetical protein